MEYGKGTYLFSDERAQRHFVEEARTFGAVSAGEMHDIEGSELNETTLRLRFREFIRGRNVDDEALAWEFFREPFMDGWYTAMRGFDS